MVDDRHDRTPTEIPDRELKVQIDKDYFKAPKSVMTGFELLRLAVKLPPDDYAIYLKVEGGQPQRIGLDETVDLSRPGVERFATLPLDQTEGLEARRDFGLPDEDVDWIISASHRYEFEPLSLLLLTHWPQRLSLRPRGTGTRPLLQVLAVLVSRSRRTAAPQPRRQDQRRE